MVDHYWTPVSQEARVLKIYTVTYRRSVLLTLNSLQAPLAILSKHLQPLIVASSSIEHGQCIHVPKDPKHGCASATGGDKAVREHW